MDAADAMAYLFSPQGRVDPYPAYERLRAHGPVVEIAPGLYVATGYAAIDEVLRDPRYEVTHEELTQHPVAGWAESPAVASLTGSMLRANPPDHGRMRQLVAGAFTPRRVAAMRDVVTAQATALVAEMARRGRDGATLDVMDEFAYPLPIGVICALLGVPEADREAFRGWTVDFAAVLEPEISDAELAVADRGAVALRDYFRDLVEARRRAPADDLTTALVQAHDAEAGRLTGDELLANLVILLAAGFETTTNLLGNGLVVLLRHPRHAAALRDDPALAGEYVEELLRIDSPVQVTSRKATVPVTPGGVPVPAGGRVLLLLGAGNRDPERFAEPSRFDPTRPHNQPLSFGGGPHYCLGAALARLEAQVAFPLLLRELPGLALAGEPRHRTRLTLRGYATLPVTVDADQHHRVVVPVPAGERGTPTGAGSGTP
ncbi:cytochrome P450 [Micromonospora sagamiensis]|uniref:Cytochrome P450 n=1 Tax=Micromonospora sagamiensis TaxID=47875 RepID=A0A562WI73_9ACTN|nr:cytochrome P450 [Micromonospora sagamiensis]TWJ30009.1 cytochrome P450 [Micromonospora sagamiensis]BCL16961.1 cytochrome P450 [Micromonospora sagamiensis]